MIRAVAALPAGTRIASRFVIEGIAGEGGMGAVYQAHDDLTGHTVALKVLSHGSREYDERFLREARALAELKHSAIVGYEEHGRTPDGISYLAMEWLEGEDLQARLAREGLTIAESVILIARLAEGLGAAHARGMVHRVRHLVKIDD